MKFVFNWMRRAWLVLAVAALIIVLDQITKVWVRGTIPLYDTLAPLPALRGYFVFEHVNNYGAAFGILQNRGNFFVAIALVVAAAILIYVRTLPENQLWIRLLLGLQLGGALGNVIDRIYQGYVTDFVKMGIPNVYYWPNYNIADSAIVVGVIGLGIYILREDMKQQPRKSADAGPEPIATADTQSSSTDVYAGDS